MYFIGYNTLGEIKRIKFSSKHKAPLPKYDGLTFIEGYGEYEEDYILNGIITKRPMMEVVINSSSISADASAKASITNVPTGTKVLINGVDHGTCADGTVEVTADFKGEYKVKLVKWPYLDKEIVINAS